MSLVVSAPQFSPQYFSQVYTLESTASTSYVDLATAGPIVTCSTGTSVIAYIAFRGACTSANAIMLGSCAVSGATTIAANDNDILGQTSQIANQAIYGFAPVLISGLTPGSNTFKLQYRTTTGTVSFSHRRLVIVPQ